MKLIFNKIFIYFLINPLEIIFYRSIYRFKGNIYVFLYNLFTFFFQKKGRIYFKDNFYFTKSSKKNYISYRFSHRKAGLFFYQDGTYNRGNIIAEDYFINKIHFKKNDVVIDVGANNGDLYLYFLYRNLKINYIGIEPSLVEFSNLKYNCYNAKLLNYAVYQKSDLKINFYISSEWGDSSLFKIKSYSKKTIVKTVTLDQVVKNYKAVKLIKIEAEGAEPECLNGLINQYKKVDYISIDAGFERGIKQESTIVECINIMNRKNFKLINFNPKRFCILFKNNN
jgi:FkbM family methyltransferase